jgi:hypothetical protein
MQEIREMLLRERKNLLEQKSYIEKLTLNIFWDVDKNRKKDFAPALENINSELLELDEMLKKY